MKRSFLLVFLLWISIGGGVIAQNRSIRFEPKDWKKAVEKARKENKLIFLDCHTSWCGPCKNLAYQRCCSRFLQSKLYQCRYGHGKGCRWRDVIQSL